MSQDERGILMSASDVITVLEIKESTLRKYALLLQNAGYKFYTNDKGQRGFYEKDVIVLKKFISIKNSNDMTLQKAANAVVSWIESSGITVPAIKNSNETERYNGDMKELKMTVEKQSEQLHQQNELLKTLMQKMDAQQQYIDQRLNERDQLLIETLRTSSTQEDGKKKSFWERLRGK